MQPLSTDGIATVGHAVKPVGRAGRPPDPTINERSLDAARELLVEQGFDATTIRAVAERAGVHSSAIYRRWPSRIELIEEATFPGLSDQLAQPTGELRRDLRRFLRAYLAAFDAPAARAAAAGLFAHRQESPSPRSPELTLRTSARPQFHDIVRAAPAETVDADVDVDDVFDMLLGAVLTRTLLSKSTGRQRPVERTVDLIIRMLRPSGQ
jgi:AcrR family transcriptional regulator